MDFSPKFRLFTIEIFLKFYRCEVALIKLFLIIILCLLIFFIAYKILVYYRSRHYFFENCCDFCANLQTQISYLKKDIVGVISEKNNYCTNFNKVLNAYKKALENLSTFNENLKKDIDKLAILKQDEKDKIFSFLTILGKSSEQEQITQIANFQQQFMQKKEETKNENVKYGGLSIKLGLLMAFGVFVIFI